MAEMLSTSASPDVALWMTLALLLLLLGALLVGWLLGRMVGPRSRWRQSMDRARDARRAESAPPDAWQESGRRLQVDRDERKDEPDGSE